MKETMGKLDNNDIKVSALQKTYLIRIIIQNIKIIFKTQQENSQPNFKKWAKNLNRHLTKENIQTVNKVPLHTYQKGQNPNTDNMKC